jgi:uncharacterized membrane protein YqaE (UPF0057 family)
MRYFFAIVLPPLGIFMCKRYVQFAVNLIFWLLGLILIPVFGIGLFIWLMCIAHAIMVCKVSSIDKRVDRIVNAIESRNQAQAAAAPAAQEAATTKQ